MYGLTVKKDSTEMLVVGRINDDLELSLTGNKTGLLTFETIEELKTLVNYEIPAIKALKPRALKLTPEMLADKKILAKSKTKILSMSVFGELDICELNPGFYSLAEPIANILNSFSSKPLDAIRSKRA